MCMWDGSGLKQEQTFLTGGRVQMLAGGLSRGKFMEAFLWMPLFSQGKKKQHHQLSLTMRGDPGGLRRY